MLKWKKLISRLTFVNFGDNVCHTISLSSLNKNCYTAMITIVLFSFTKKKNEMKTLLVPIKMKWAIKSPSTCQDIIVILELT